MDSCSFNHPHIIAGYYEGTLPENEKKAFSEHLLTCSECMESLLNLEREVFLMHNIPFAGLPEGLGGKKAIFCLMKEGLKILKNLGGKQVFVPVSFVPARGNKRYNAYSLKSGDILINIIGREEQRFDLEIGEVKGKNLILYRENRVVEAHHFCSEEKIRISRLKPGDYTLKINNSQVVSFNIEAPPWKTSQ